MRDRLIELLKSATVERGIYTSDGRLIECYKTLAVETKVVEHLADYLLANGVIVPPCKVGQTVWFPSEYYGSPFPITITRLEVYEEETVMYSDGGGEWYDGDFGKTIFLTREEAEKALKERSEG